MIVAEPQRAGRILEHEDHRLIGLIRPCQLALTVDQHRLEPCVVRRQVDGVEVLSELIELVSV